MTAELFLRLEAGFDAHRDDERAAGAAAYMRNQFAFYGIPSATQSLIAREALTGLPAPSERDLTTVARRAWKKSEREWQYFACGYLRRNIKIASADFIDVARDLITTKSWWDTIDSLAGHTVGPLVTAHPELVATMDGWIADENFWLARTAILHQLAYRQRTDPDRLFRYCLLRAGEKEFFIRKAIGWALREYTKTDAPAVKRFLRTHGDALSGLSRTEAIKWLDRRAARA